jgi:hypothetical protein
VSEWASDKMLRFLFRAFKQETIINDIVFRSPIISDDGCAKLYLKGTRNAFETHGHGNDIIRFLCS